MLKTVKTAFWSIVFYNLAMKKLNKLGNRVMDVLESKPVKEAVVSAGHVWAEKLLFGHTGLSPDLMERKVPEPSRPTSYDTLIFETRAAAEEILVTMRNLLESNGVVTQENLYVISGYDPIYLDTKWGWTDLKDAKTVRVRDGFRIDFPPITDLSQKAST